MTTKNALNIVVLLAGVIGAVYYTATNQEAQGAVVVLLAILYFVALPHISWRTNRAT